MGSIKAAKALLAAGADRTLTNQAGETALDVAKRKGNLEVAAALGL